MAGLKHKHGHKGCACDIDAHWYSLSTDLNPYWNKTHVPHHEIKSYWRDLTVKYSLSDQIILNRNVTSADWDNKKQLYRIRSHDVQTNENFEDEAHIVISATGILSVPSYPKDLDSIKNFKGPTFHSARWDHSVDLKNKRVAVVGNGCSA